MKNYTDEKSVDCISKNNGAVIGAIAGAAPGSSVVTTATYGYMITFPHFQSRILLVAYGLVMMVGLAIEFVRKARDWFRRTMGFCTDWF